MGFSWTRAFDPLNVTGLDHSAQDRADANAQSYRDAMGRPLDPTYHSIYDPATMSMTGDIDQRLSGINYDGSALDQFQGEAERQGPSKWANQATNQQEQLYQNALDMGAQQVAGQGATARSQLAMRGGLTGGARERVATEGQKNYLDMAQGLGQQKATNEMQVGLNDEQNRIQQLGMVPGMQAQKTGIDLSKLGIYGQARQTDTANQMADNQASNQFNMDRYNAQMGEWGANQTAAATAQAGKHKK